jgi:hypothetical protein
VALGRMYESPWNKMPKRNSERPILIAAPWAVRSQTHWAACQVFLRVIRSLAYKVCTIRAFVSPFELFQHDLSLQALRNRYKLAANLGPIAVLSS